MIMTDSLATLAQEELALIKQPLLTFGQSLQAPNENFLSALAGAQTVLLTLPQLSIPAQSTLLSFIGAALVAKLNTVGTATPATGGAASGTAA
jgi:hypothetical protein